MVNIRRKSGSILDLLGNSIWKDISERLDSDFVDAFIWINKNKFQNDVKYKYEQLKRLCNSNFEEVIYPTFSREYAVDKIVKVLSAKEKIGNKGNIINYRNSRIKKLGNSYYTKLIETSNEVHFEFYKNKDFFEKLLNEGSLPRKPYIPNLNNIQTPKQPYVLMIPGAGRPHKMWDQQNFSKIANYLKQEYGLEIILSGSPSEKNIGVEVEKNASVEVMNKIEDSDLLDLIGLVQNSELLVTNETSAVHFAAAMGKKAVCISDGSYFGRFHPYPPEITKEIIYIYPDQISNNFDNFKVLFENYSGVSNLDINSISVDKVIGEIDKLLKA